jgi:heme-degrading monooxygenase HmoA
MIARVWHGWASSTGADTYQEHFQSTVVINLKQVQGFRAAELWRREEQSEVEFVAVTTWESLDAVRAFAGADYERAVVEPEARGVLTKFDQRVKHYEIVVSTRAEARVSGS